MRGNLVPGNTEQLFIILLENKFRKSTICSLYVHKIFTSVALFIFAHFSVSFKTLPDSAYLIKYLISFYIFVIALISSLHIC